MNTTPSQAETSAKKMKVSKPSIHPQIFDLLDAANQEFVLAWLKENNEYNYKAIAACQFEKRYGTGAYIPAQD